MQREVARRWLAPYAATTRGGARTSARAQTGGPLQGTDIPGYTAAGPAEPVKVVGPGAGRVRLAARRRQALPADGVQRRRADRLAGLRRAARGALARSARTSPTTSRRRSPWSPTPRSIASARWSTSRPAPCSAAARRFTTPRPTRGRSRPRSRSCSAATTTWRRSATPTTGGSPASTRPICSRTSGRSFAAGRLRSTPRCSSPRRPPGRSSGSSRRRSSGARRRGAHRAHRPHRLRRRAPLPRSPSRRPRRSIRR